MALMLRRVRDDCPLEIRSSARFCDVADEVFEFRHLVGWHRSHLHLDPRGCEEVSVQFVAVLIGVVANQIAARPIRSRTNPGMVLMVYGLDFVPVADASAHLHPLFNPGDHIAGAEYPPAKNDSYEFACHVDCFEERKRIAEDQPFVPEALYLVEQDYLEDFVGVPIVEPRAARSRRKWCAAIHLAISAVSRTPPDATAVSISALEHS